MPQSAVMYIPALSRAGLSGGSGPVRKQRGALSVFQNMQLRDLDPPKALPCISTIQLRDNLSEAINCAAYGMEPVLVMRRGRKIAAIISLDDLAFLELMKHRRNEAWSEPLPTDQSQIGSALARRREVEDFFG